MRAVVCVMVGAFCGATLLAAEEPPVVVNHPVAGTLVLIPEGAFLVGSPSERCRRHPQLAARNRRSRRCWGYSVRRFRVRLGLVGEASGGTEGEGATDGYNLSTMRRNYGYSDYRRFSDDA